MALKNFPIKDAQEVKTQEMFIKLDGTESRHKKQTENHWFYHSDDKKQTLAITPSSCYIKYLNYISFEHLNSVFLSILKSLFDQYPDISFNALGLRYINIIKLENEKSVFDWEGFINKSLLSSLAFISKKELISRSLNTLNLKYENHRLKFVYGMHNPDFPAAIRKKVFVLDYDARFDGLIENDRDAENILSEFHDNIIDLFERSIEDKLRSKMNND